LKIQDSGFRIQDSGFRIQDSGFRIQDSGFRVHADRQRCGTGSSTVAVTCTGVKEGGAHGRQQQLTVLSLRARARSKTYIHVFF
jgi:hypothetical protein